MNSRRIAVALVVLGAILLLSSGFGFSSVTAERGVSVSVASDPNALLGVYDVSGSASTIHKNQGGAIPFEFDDNGNFIGSADDIEATITGYGTTTDPGLTASVRSSGTRDYEVLVECGDYNQNSNGVLTLQIDVTSGPIISLERTTDQRLRTNCKSGGPGDGGGNTNDCSSGTGDISEGCALDLSGTGQQTQTFKFELGSDLSAGQTVTIDLSDTDRNGNKGIGYSDPGTGGPGSVSLDSASMTLTYTADGSESAGETISVEVTADPGENADKRNTAPYTVMFEGPDGNSVQNDFSVK